MPSTRIQTPNNKTVKKQLNGLKRKTKISLPSNFIKSMAKLQRGLFLRPNRPKSVNKKIKK